MSLKKARAGNGWIFKTLSAGHPEDQRIVFDLFPGDEVLIGKPAREDSTTDDDAFFAISGANIGVVKITIER